MRRQNNVRVLPKHFFSNDLKNHWVNWAEPNWKQRAHDNREVPRIPASLQHFAEELLQLFDLPDLFNMPTHPLLFTLLVPKLKEINKNHVFTQDLFSGKFSVVADPLISNILWKMLKFDLLNWATVLLNSQPLISAHLNVSALFKKTLFSFQLHTLE